jgi:hypothetical protein
MTLQKNLFPLKLEDSVRMITFNDIHPEIPRRQENKSLGADLVKDRETMPEGSAKRQTNSHTKYDF